MAMKSRPSLAVHPGEILREEFLRPRGLNPGVLAGAIGVAPKHMKDIVKGEKSISRETAVLLAGYYGTSASSGSIFRVSTKSGQPAQQTRRLLGRL